MRIGKKVRALVLTEFDQVNVNKAIKETVFRLIISLFFILFFSFILWSEHRVISKNISPGCVFSEIIDPETPLSIYVLKVDLTNKNIRIRSVLAQDNFNGLESVLSMSQRNDKPGHRIIGAVNGDFYVGTTPIGMGVIDGQLLKSSGGRTSIIFDQNNSPQIGIFSIQMQLSGPKGFDLNIDALNNPAGKPDAVLYTYIFGERTQEVGSRLALILDPLGQIISSHGSLKLAVDGECPLPKNNLIPEGKFILSVKESLSSQLQKVKREKTLALHVSTLPVSDRIYTAISGGPQIISQGKICVGQDREGFRKGFSSEKHPRTAVGYIKDRRFLIMMVVDGRRPDYSRGVDLIELAELMLSFECYEAINLDGGGSSTMVINNEVVNQPSDFTGPRPVANCLLVVNIDPEKNKIQVP